MRLEDVEEKHAEYLGIPDLMHRHILEIDKDLVRAAVRPESPSSLALAESWNRLQDLRSHFAWAVSKSIIKYSLCQITSFSI